LSITMFIRMGSSQLRKTMPLNRNRVWQKVNS